MKKILVTGAAGFLGHKVVENLLENDTSSEVFCLVRVTSKLEMLKSVIENYPDARVNIIYGDLTSKDDIAKATKSIDTIYHLAASLSGSPAEMFYNNCVTLEFLLDSIDRKKIKRVILVSSFGVYGWAKLKPGTLVDENVPLEAHPEKRDTYSHTKYVQEEIFKEYCIKNNIPYVILRPGVIFGPHGPLISSRVGVDLFGLFLFIGGNNNIPFTYVDNCADAIVRAGMVPDIEGECFNVVDDDVVTCRDYLKLYKKSIKRTISIRVPYRLFILISYMFEIYNKLSKGQLPDEFTVYKTKSMWKGFKFTNNKAKKVLNWHPQISFEQGFKTTVESLDR